ncbi:MAG TPA: hypothetical protein VGP07_07670 [Polyangia bacterium]|jgi:hypothetical protein
MKPIARSIVVRSVVVCLGFVAVLCVANRSALAQTNPPPPTSSGGNGIGVGASAFLSGLEGVQVDYDLYNWDIEGVFSFGDRDNGNGMSRTYLQAGARGWWHLHHGSSSDFSVGGGIGFLNASGGGGPSVTTTLIEPGVRARAFVTPNVSVQAILGLSIEIGDNDAGANARTGVALAGQPLFTAGFTYYFH